MRADRTLTIPTWASQVASRVEIHLSHAEWDIAHAVLDRAQLQAMRRPLRLSQVERLAMPVSEMGVNLRLVHLLEQHEILTVHDLLDCREETLLAIRHFGVGYLSEVFRALERMGFK